MKVKFEKYSLVANVTRNQTSKRRIEVLKDSHVTRYSPLSFLKSAIKKMDISEKGKEKVFELGKKIIKEAL